MNRLWIRLLLQLAAVALAAVAGLLRGTKPAIWCAIVLVCAMLVYQVRQIGLLLRFMARPEPDALPRGFGIWEEVYYRLNGVMRRLQRETQQAQLEHARFIQAIQASPNGVVMLDRSDHIEWCNSVAEQHFRLDNHRDQLQKIQHLVRQPVFIEYLSGGDFHDPIVMRDMGARGQTTLSVQLIPYGEGRKLLASQDITQIEKTETTRRDFVANVSHELKTPLTVLAGFLETVRDLPLSEEDRQRYIETMHSQAMRMQSLVDDLLTLAKLEGNTAPPEDKIMPMGLTMERLRADADALSGGRHRIQMECDADWDLAGSEVELMSVFGNLVSNAVRYTPDGGTIKFSWHGPVPGQEGSTANFSVQDSGIGIAAEHLPRLTERFYRVDRGRSRSTGGTGLGLSIAKHVLSRHNATLDVQSEIGKGSTFTARFQPSRVRLKPQRPVATA
ncbi:MAG: phosphate regulon sensor histidine kinase PhoR [Candidatus Protistobacter heckmanni]|nr:phosphate regulon sensor histidine kinase PhoR [Candidatus Protistobacter heckmanni]